MRIQELDIAKGIGIILVVLGHSFLLPGPTVESNFYLSILRSVIYSFHMPLFFCIAGYFMKTENKTFKDVLLSKSKRLLIPYFFLGTVFAPIKMYLSHYAQHPYDISQFFTIFYGHNVLSELWFLYFLFVISVIYFWLNSFMAKKYVVLIALFGYFVLVTNEINQPFLVNTFYFFPFFLLGTFIREYNYLTKIKFSSLTLFISTIFFVLTNYFLYPVYYNDVYARGYYSSSYYLLFAITSLLGIIIVYQISLLVANRVFGGTCSAILSEFGSFSMDIYILSDFITVMARIVLFHLLHSYHMAWVFGFVFGVVGSYLISKFLVRPIPILRKLLFGA